mgnify:CR=1 FL=1
MLFRSELEKTLASDSTIARLIADSSELNKYYPIVRDYAEAKQFITVNDRKYLAYLGAPRPVNPQNSYFVVYDSRGNFYYIDLVEALCAGLQDESHRLKLALYRLARPSDSGREIIKVTVRGPGLQTLRLVERECGFHTDRYVVVNMDKQIGRAHV